MKILIRKKELRDCESCEKIITQSWQSTYRGIIDDDYLNKLVINEKIRIENAVKNFENAEKVLVAECDGKVVGFVRYGECDLVDYKSSAEIYALYITDEYQGFGLGKALVKEASRILLDQGYTDLIIGCIDKNPSNGFYQHLKGIKVAQREIVRGRILQENIYYFNDLNTLAK